MKKVLIITNRFKDTDQETTNRIKDFLAKKGVECVCALVDRKVKSLDPALFEGIELALVHFILGVVLCVTIVGIPFGKQFFKFAKLSLAPFGAHVV